jgi:exodeoxyribonuclease III
MRLATWNVNSLVARLPKLLAWLEEHKPDVVCLQETKVAEASFPTLELASLGYDVAAHGAGRWNGVAILSRVGLAEVRRGFPEEPPFEQVEARAIDALCGGVRVWSLYVPNGRTLDSPHYTYKLAWLSSLRAALSADGAASRPTAICGDFNIAPTDNDVWDPRQFVGSTHVSAAERDALAGLLELGFTDVQPRAMKGRPFTYWDYRAGMFHKGEGMRIDLVLLSDALAPRMTDAWIDREARKGTAPSDHAPVVVDLTP